MQGTSRVPTAAAAIADAPLAETTTLSEAYDMQLGDRRSKDCQIDGRMNYETKLAAFEIHQWHGMAFNTV